MYSCRQGFNNSSGWLVVIVYSSGYKRTSIFAIVGCSFEQIDFDYYELTVPPSDFDYPTTYIIHLVMYFLIILLLLSDL